ncbi:benzoyl-CoA reductase/2-hydroxyglutaryl-CoA dehydratase subunit BcrC/BadD/HgdB [Clostridium tetanomorphum]|uniref:2-hydroxyacyl-CoA dehydratase n=1 Tax=Clostridium tetanomorphum TaxID=1553 RepID=A0A923J0T7_CLOTT|nr:2-hydroxyacyl-CoA dehydratase [Clostridium tetanomorphum]MBC2398621.1 2-hydroxyacyl-CoA dehydratase [Clostridium tetanomorphum]MBP1864102.1 benzoyl-CoA reductase/2-hydroxyglutaryl-CoA dehydratase subunit BcrC/BadD/HgdB [Clostridium tetanomorphum]NRS84515.1 benzoyl-CoA reductase/2-hydroxyglutaryl-CoA dehydratase subunit BcrC/BadD/HgdB [Clostridium tetanomorphum]NRZ97729.1 benzoyl-CoA reductase/2-hydroxyglutaryl-CoA dehydratase subunit BcrC/BadD/HgdB [Clostridium tetanomorphum]SQB91989.1 2-hy
MKKIGLTTTVPVEVLIAAEYTPVDLNNIFITSDDYLKYIDIAERDGFPKSLCAWIKGIYGACLENNIEEIVGVIEGDCSNTKALIEVLQLKGIKVYPFSFPHSHKKEDVESEIKKFMNIFNVTFEKVEAVRKRLNKIRELAKEIDELTYKESKTTGFENHLYQVSLSDFNGNTNSFEAKLKKVINNIKKRQPIDKKLRLGYIGVPPMTGNIYEFVEKFNAHFVYNEVQREFAFPRANESLNIFEQYYDYTYPYNTEFRIKELKKQIKERKLDALIHYTQAFCYRAVEDIVLKQNLDIPILNIEGDKLNTLDARTKLRLEAFLDMLLDLKESRKC